jgi:hypothetical protein
MGQLQVTQPSAGDSYVVDQIPPAITAIIWTTVRGDVTTIPKIDIQYSPQGGAAGTWKPLPGGTFINNDGFLNNWTVPDDIALNVKFRIRDANYPDDVIAPMNGLCSIRGALAVNNPILDEVWLVGETRTITWTSTGTFTPIELTFSHNGSDWTVISATCTNVNGKNAYIFTAADWSKIENTADSSNCRIKVSSTDGWQNISAQSNKFTIKGSISINAPAGGSVFIPTQSVGINGTKSSGIDKITLQVRKNRGTWDNIIQLTSLSGLTTWSHNWTVSDCISTNVEIRALDTSDNMTLPEADRPQALSNPFTVKGAIVAIDRPNSSDSWLVGDAKTISWTLTGSIAQVNIYYSPDNFVTTTKTIATQTATDPGSPYTHPDAASGKGTKLWPIPDDIDPSIYIRVVDANDPTVSATSSAFKIKGEFQIISQPATNTVWAVGKPMEIKWEVRGGSMKNVRLTYQRPGIDLNPIEIKDSTPATSSLKSGLIYYGTYTWPSIADAINSGVSKVYIYIEDKDNSDVTFTSDPFNIRADFQVITPNGGNTYLVYDNPRQMTTFPINWLVTGTTLNTVNLEYSTNGDAGPWNLIDPWNVLGGGSFYYEWYVNNAIGTQIKIRVIDGEYTNCVSDTSNANFTIKGKLEITAPDAASAWSVGDTNRTISWRVTGSVGWVRIEYLKKNQDPALDTSWEIITSTFNCPSTADYNYIWSAGVADVITPTARIRVKPVAGSESRAEAGISAPFIIRSKITVGKPLAGDNYFVYNSPTQASTYPITWTYTGDVTYVKITYTTGTNWADIARVLASSLSYNWPVADAIPTLSFPWAMSTPV